jgi:hypothetical protein
MLFRYKDKAEFIIVCFPQKLAFQGNCYKIDIFQEK